MAERPDHSEMADRPDHFAYLRTDPEVGKPEVPPVGFSPDQLEELERIFGPIAQLGLITGARNTEGVWEAKGIGRGYADMLAYIRQHVKVG